MKRRDLLVLAILVAASILGIFGLSRTPAPQVHLNPIPQAVTPRILTVPPPDNALTHPIFAAGRLPVDGEKPGELVPDGPPQIVGAVAGNGAATIWVRSATGQEAAARLGDQVDGWRVTKITARGATLARGNQTKTVDIEFGHLQGKGDGKPASPLDTRAPKVAVDLIDHFKRD